MRRLTAAALVVALASCTAVSAPPATAPASAVATASTAARPLFLTYAFTDVRAGTTFTLSDFAGKTVLVIGMAVW